MSRRIKTWLPTLSCLLLILLTGCQPQGAEPGDWIDMPLPDIRRQPLHLRVAHVVNPRFGRLDDHRLRAILKRTEQMCQRFFNIDIVFESPDTVAIERFFAYLDRNVIDEVRTEVVDIDRLDAATRAAMRESILQTLRHYQGSEHQVIDYARPYLVEPLPQDAGLDHLADALLDTLIIRLRHWHQRLADDGKPVLDGSPYNQWVWWDSMGYSDMPYDVVITNQLVASAERYGMDVHSSLRGGITAGTTTFSKQARYGSYVYIMLYPMLNDDPLLNRLRNDRHYDERQTVEYAAALLTHELGHMLLHLGHPFGNTRCIMSPTPLLRYRQWTQTLDPRACPVGSSKAMTPGAAGLQYNRRW